MGRSVRRAKLDPSAEDGSGLVADWPGLYRLCRDAIRSGRCGGLFKIHVVPRTAFASVRQGVSRRTGVGSNGFWS